jgi:hypothetical protein
MDQERRVSACLRRLGMGLIVAGGLAAAAAHPAMAQEGNVADSPLFHNVKDPKVVATQVRTALPAYEHGLGLLTSNADAESTATAVKYLLDAYRYLRGAYESNQLIMATDKFPDPLLTLQNKQIMDVRMRLLACTGRREYLTDSAQIREGCIDGLNGGLRTLRMLVATLP